MDIFKKMSTKLLYFANYLLNVYNMIIHISLDDDNV